ncbi:hypothetical protein [Campylobacter blaseri]|uniref:hypothetical protein n=1 Tax=Campylobacter blaseri TaxID=2042961 RepID=UPI00130005AF|nr:hypothetical protein [Campylobacter blaseri]
MGVVGSSPIGATIASRKLENSQKKYQILSNILKSKANDVLKVVSLKLENLQLKTKEN